MKDAFGVDREAVSKKFEPLSAGEKKAGKMSLKEKAVYAGSLGAAGAGGFTLGLKGIKSKAGAAGAAASGGAIGASAVLSSKKRNRINEHRASQGKGPRGFWTGQPKS
jgi:hypothetical protein